MNRCAPTFGASPRSAIGVEPAARPHPAAPAAPNGGGAGPQVQVSAEALLAREDEARNEDDRERANTVAAHVALLRPDHSFDAAADEYLTRATLDGVAPQLICDQLGVGLAELKARWALLQVPGITVIDGRRDADGCQLLLDMLSRRAELEAA